MASLHLHFPDIPAKNGLYNIKIRLYHKRGEAIISTPFSVARDEFRDGFVTKRADASLINLKLHGLLTQYVSALEQIPNPDSYSCHQIKQLLCREITAKGQTLFSEESQKIIENLKKDKRESYAGMVERSARYFMECCGDLPLNGILPEHVEDFTYFLRRKKASTAYEGICLSHVKMILNTAIRERKVRYDTHPFLTTRIRRSVPKDTAITKKDMKKMILSRPDSYKYIVSRDLFCLSFYLGGMNLVDILAADFSDDEVKYVRTKTKGRTQGVQTVCIPLIDEAKEIISRYIGRNGRLEFRYKFSSHNFSIYVTRNIKLWAKEIGIKDPVVFYTARKTFAQTALDLGIADNVTDAALGHTGTSRGTIAYYSKVRARQIGEALRKIVDYIME